MSTVTVSGNETSSAQVTTVTVSGSGTDSAQASTVTVTASGTATSKTSCHDSTITVTPTHNKHEDVLYTAYIKTTTTIIAPPTATVEGTTTVWVRPSSQQSVWTQTSTYVVTATDSALDKRNLAAGPEAFAGPALVNHPVSGVLEARRALPTDADIIESPTGAVECFASVDGQWIISTCALPTATNVAEI